MSGVETITRHADVLAVLNDPRHLVPCAPEDGGGGLAWLRASVSRFSNGPTHQRRRALLEAELARIDPADLRRRAYRRAAAGEEPGTVPVGVLAEVLGARFPVVDAVVEVARGYLDGATDAARDAAADRLVDAFGGARDEATAARICLLVQACAGTERLIDSAARFPGVPLDALLAETLRHDPPVRATTRTDGSPVRLDLAAANRDPAVFADPERFAPGRADADRHLAFGAGPRACPGRDHALALAAGVLEALRR